MIEIFILSIIQGITEFLPISSSSHLILFSEYLNFENQNLSIDVSLHIGSFIAVMTYFYKEIINFYENKILFFKIFISSLPVMLIGFLMVEFNYIDKIRNIEIIAWTTLIFAILLYFADKFKVNKKLNAKLDLKTINIESIDDIKNYPFVEITNLLSFYEESSITNYLKNQSIVMNTIVKTDSYSSALSIVTDGMAISILDDNSIKKANLKKVKVSKILDKKFRYRISAIKKDIVRYECNEFFNYLCEQKL